VTWYISWEKGGGRDKPSRGTAKDKTVSSTGKTKTRGEKNRGILAGSERKPGRNARQKRTAKKAEKAAPTQIQNTSWCGGKKWGGFKPQQGEQKEKDLTTKGGGGKEGK